jgi:hypothetical protein
LGSIGLGEETSFVVVSWRAPKAWEYPLAHKLNIVDLWINSRSVSFRFWPFSILIMSKFSQTE